MSPGTSPMHIITPLERITKDGSIKLKDDKVTTCSILAIRAKKKVDNKRPMPHEIIDKVKIGVLQNFDTCYKLNPVDIAIRDSKANSFLARCRRYKYRFVMDNLLFSSALTNNTNAIFVSCNGLNEAKESLVNGKLLKPLVLLTSPKLSIGIKLRENLNVHTSSL